MSQDLRVRVPPRPPLDFYFTLCYTNSMSKLNNKSIFLGLKILSILAFSLLIIPFNSALAEGGRNYTYYNDYSYNSTPAPKDTTNPKPVIDSITPKSINLGVGTKTITITGSGFVPSSVARVNNSSRPTTFIDSTHLLVQITGNDTSAYKTNGGFFITVYNVAPGGGYSNGVFFTVNNPVTPATTTGTNDNTTSPDTYTEVIEAENQTDSYSNLASNAIFGLNSFLPSGLIQWILFAILILLIVIVARRIFGAKENYDQAPMKHA